MAAAFQDSGFAFQGTGQFAFQTALGSGVAKPKEEPAGRGKRRYRNIYRIRVDGEPFEFTSYQSALDFLVQAKKAAAELADRTLLEAIEEQRQTPTPLPVLTFKDPVIVASSRDLRSAVSDAKKEIAAIYAKAKRNAEIAMYLEVVSRDQYNEEIIWFL